MKKYNAINELIKQFATGMPYLRLILAKVARCSGLDETLRTAAGGRPRKQRARAHVRRRHA